MKEYLNELLEDFSNKLADLYQGIKDEEGDFSEEQLRNFIDSIQIEDEIISRMAEKLDIDLKQD